MSISKLSIDKHYLVPFKEQVSIKTSQWTDVYGLYSQINILRNGNVFSCVLKFGTLSAALMLSDHIWMCYNQNVKNEVR